MPAKGYRARLTTNGVDFGADIVLGREGECTVAPAKHWKSHEYWVKAIQEENTATPYYQADKAMVVTTG